LKIDEAIKTQATLLARANGISFSDIVESALRNYLKAGKEVVENGN